MQPRALAATGPAETAALAVWGPAALVVKVAPVAREEMEAMAAFFRCSLPVLLQAVMAATAAAAVTAVQVGSVATAQAGRGAKAVLARAVPAAR